MRAALPFVLAIFLTPTRITNGSAANPLACVAEADANGTNGSVTHPLDKALRFVKICIARVWDKLRYHFVT